MQQSTKTILSLSVLLLGACSVSDGGETSCGGVELAPEICEAVQASSMGGGKADEIAELKGIIVERSGDRVFFKIPLAHTADADQQRLLDETIDRFTAEVDRLGEELDVRGVDLSGVMDVARGESFTDDYMGTLDSLFTADVEGDMEVRLGEEIAQPRELWAWQRYVVPQAFIGYFGTKFSANIGVGVGISATILIVVQPWLSLEIENNNGEPTVVAKRYEIDVAVLGVPNVDVGFGAGGGMPIRIGAGAVFGPLDRPQDLAGWGVGLSGSFALPLAGGGQAKFITVLQDPPLFIAMAGYNTGTAAGAEIHGNLQYIMDVDEFLTWLDSGVTF